MCFCSRTKPIITPNILSCGHLSVPLNRLCVLHSANCFNSGPAGVGLGTLLLHSEKLTNKLFSPLHFVICHMHSVVSTPDMHLTFTTLLPNRHSLPDLCAQTSQVAQLKGSLHNDKIQFSLRGHTVIHLSPWRKFQNSALELILHIIIFYLKIITIIHLISKFLKMDI